MPLRRAWPSLAAAVVVLSVAAPAAQARELHWRELAVDARLDADGRLHVVERQEMVFTGDWNGGERFFDVRLGQDLDLHRVTRIDADGTETEVLEGSLDDVDRYDWADNRTLRWRSRRPEDPPFHDTTITYVLEYTLSGILVPGRRPDVWTLDHDFAFAEREGAIERLIVDLELDPVWEPPTHFRGHYDVAGLPFGQGWVGTWQLVYTGEGVPAAVPRPTPAWYRQCAAAAAGLAVLFLVGALFRREAALGRLSRPEGLPHDPDRAWVDEHLLSLPAEQAGALWDRRVSTAEVAGLLARLVAEGKLSSEVEPKRGLFGSEVLRLRLEVPHDSFQKGYERALIDKLFFQARTETDTEAVRKHYRSKGFDPVGLIKGGIESGIKKRVKGHSAAPKPRRTRMLLLACAVAWLLEGLTHSWASLLLFGILTLFVSLPVFGIASALAVAWRNRVERAVPWALPWLAIGLWLFAIGVAVLFVDVVFGTGTLGVYPGLFGVLAILLWPLALVSSLTNLAASRDGRQAIRRRQEIAHARRWLARQLRRERPDLDDSWLPHLIALGLGGDVTRWGKRWAVAAAGTAAGLSTFGGSSTSSSAGGLGRWTGGGGAFGGAGASAAWATAAAGMASSVSPPGSSGSGGGGGGGGGGGSSGGGGGGGW